jgi:hypothetical protein
MEMEREETTMFSIVENWGFHHIQTETISSFENSVSTRKIPESHKQ